MFRRSLKVKLALPLGEGGEVLFMDEGSYTGKREERSSVLALWKCCLETFWILPNLKKGTIHHCGCLGYREALEEFGPSTGGQASV